jgi:hypothetical protein
VKVSTNKIPKNIVGAAGEYFVAAELSRRGVIATITLKNTPNIDLIASTVDGQRTVTIQVKTKQNPQGWKLDKRIETQVSTGNFFIVFVDLAKLGSVNYYIVPRNVLANAIAKDHQKWLATPGRKGRAHADTDLRAFDPPRFPDFEKYKNNWQLLGLW